MLNHSNKAGFMCSICGISFRYEYGLRRHERRHELQDENGKYTCNYCDKTFADSWKVSTSYSKQMKTLSYYGHDTELVVVFPSKSGLIAFKIFRASG